MNITCKASNSLSELRSGLKYVKLGETDAIRKT
jgi:hypothetical protein